MNFTNKTPTRSYEDLFTIEDDPEIMQLNFPPTEIEGSPEYTFLPAEEKELQYFFYPKDVDRREYQFEIVEECFHQNTLVCLPTGSGKTLIAAVVMMNFRRWYPKGKIIFMAPYRTLVMQQIDACISKTSIKKEEVSILTGTTFTGNRSRIWKEKSIFFCTPQIVQNDLSKNVLNPYSVCLLIIDEAHHASGSYAYVNVVRMIAASNSQFRVVGLSATPGSDIDKIQVVIYNLMISKIIYKDDDDIEIAKYQHKTDIEIVKVPLGNDESKLEDYLLQCITSFAEPLSEKGYIKLPSSPKWMTHGAVWRAMDQFKNNNNRFQIPDFFKIMDSFGTLLSLATMQEKLTKYGAAMLNDSIKDFIKKKKESECKKKLVSMTAFQQLQRDSETSKNISHPKLAKLTEILGDFYSENIDSRAIVFTKYRDAAHAIVDCLKKVKGVKASIFIGKADTRKTHGLDESTQIEIVSLFRHGNINCIVATSVAEEGLDIGEVDLIICYDTSSSPRTTVQRMGRTGRKRSGKVIFLMSEGYEEKNLEKAQYTRALIKRKLTSAIGNFVLYKPEIPNLPIPENCKAFNVSCLKPDKSNERFLDDTDKSKKRKKNNDGNSDGSSTSRSPFLSKKEITGLECCFGSSISYKDFEIDNSSYVFDHGYTIISHSAESNILFSMKNDFLLSFDIEKQLEIESKNDDQIRTKKFKDNSKNPFFVDDSSDDSDDDTEEIDDFDDKENSSPSTSPLLPTSSKFSNPSTLSILPPQKELKQNNQKYTKNRISESKVTETKQKKLIQKQLVSSENNKVLETNQNRPKFIPVSQINKMKQTDLLSFAPLQEAPIKEQSSPILEMKQRRFLDSDDEDDDYFLIDENSNHSYGEEEVEENVTENKSKSVSFLSDDDDDSGFDDFIYQKNKSKFNYNYSEQNDDEQVESECPDIIAVRRELCKKSTSKFLNDSEFDSFDVDEYLK